MRQIYTFIRISKAIRQFVSLFKCFERVANLKLFWQFCKSKQKQFHVRKPNTKRVSNQKNCRIALEILKKNMDLSRIYLAVKNMIEKSRENEGALK